MNKRIWKLLTLVGFALSVVVFGMILALRFQLFDRLSPVFQSLNRSVALTQQASEALTQFVTQEAGSGVLEADRKNLQRLTQACFSGNDCIPAIDDPKFVSVRQASKFLKDDDLVIGVAFDNWQKEDDPVKAYPVKILNWHEVVNDFVNETPVAVTYSPLTMAHRVFETMSDGGVDSLGVSGMVLNSGVVLYDRDTKSLWNQFDGAALTGPKRDQRLKLYPSVLVRWADWMKEYPATVVLSVNTGFDYNYSEYPYGDYVQSTDIYYPLEHSDTRRKLKEMLFGVVFGDHAKIYPETELAKALSNGNTVSDEFSGKKLILSYDRKNFKAVDALTGEAVPVFTGYYFAWEAFYPGVEIYQAQVPVPAI